MDIMKFHFDRRLALATGIASAGAGAGTVGLTKLLGWAVGYGLGSAFLCLAAIMVPGLLFSLAFVPPPNLTLVTTQFESPTKNVLIRYKTILTSLPFLIYLLGRFLLTASYGAFFAFAAADAKHAFGLSEEEAGTVLALSGAAALVGKVSYIQCLPMSCIIVVIHKVGFGLLAAWLPTRLFLLTGLSYAGLSLGLLLSGLVPSMTGQVFIF